ncbi:hypothetical protein [Cellulosimicrobium sp. NPDC057862]|uniref:hypothetical protein n=1 Tax=Cellulosimicrobium sp. NPDC057862 TaxID=3346266 RepID=UPI00366B916E
MKPRVDLDDLARRLESAVADWSKVAEVGPFMWHDRTADDQRRVTLERASVAIPEALSFRSLTRFPGQVLLVDHAARSAAV